MSGHFKEVGSCGHVIATCKCISASKTIITKNHPCPACVQMELRSGDK
jgi:hypothetical protein